MEIHLQDRVAVVTGGGRNLGEGIATALAGIHGRVVVVDLDREAAERVATRINRQQEKHAFPFQADVTDERSVKNLVGEIVDLVGPISALVNCVATSDRKDLFELELEEWESVLRSTLTSAFLVTKHVATSMVATGTPGAVVNISSTYAQMAKPNGLAYPAAKAAVIALTRSLALQLAPHRIRVNSVTPDQVGTPVGQDEMPSARPLINLVGRLAMPEDIARVVAFLLSDEASFVSGVDWVVDGGALAALLSWPRLSAVQEPVVILPQGGAT